MSLLLRPTSTPDTKPRVWYQALFKYATPPKARLTQQQAAALVAANWHRTWDDIKRNGVDIG